MQKIVFNSFIGFVKIKPDEKKANCPFDPLDLTRIHSDSYLLSKKISADAVKTDN